MFRTDFFVENTLSPQSRRVKIIAGRQQTPRDHRLRAPPGLFEIRDQIFCLLHDVTISINISFRHRALLPFLSVSSCSISYSSSLQSPCLPVSVSESPSPSSL